MTLLRPHCSKNWLAPLCALVLALTAIAPARADIYGPGGLLLNPTADMAPRGEISPSALAIPQEGPGVLGGNRTLVSYGLNYGLSDNIEIGASQLRLNPSNGPKDDPSYGATAKVRVLRGKTDGRPDIAIGGALLRGGDFNGEFGFVATRFSTKVDSVGSGAGDDEAHLHLGLLWAGDLYGVKRNEVVPYAGVDLPLASKLRAFAEIRSRMDGVPVAQRDVQAPSAAGIIWNPTRGIKIVAAFATNGQSRKLRPSIGVGYTFGVRKSSK